MDINEFLGYELICKMSDELKNESQYQEGEFTVIIQEDTSCDEGYSAIVRYTIDGNSDEDIWEINLVMNNLAFGTWKIIKKNRI